ncbi:S-locus glycoprotein [Trema orientale]|uniref:S-locus glycoprotein n=1 Tax=Trema orientale TaxID=63057 RepID=A0A2P5F9V6_TREOI|nr:S-locus glycoprotein [Trema orientale]
MAKLRGFISIFLSCVVCIQFSFLSGYAELFFSFNQGQEIRDLDDSDHLLSTDGFFKLGFFHPGSSSPLGQSSNTYLGIWYGKLPNNPEAVWVANPNDPIIDSSGIFTLDFDGKLKITHKGGQPIVLNPNQQVSGNVTASLLNFGNFELRELIANGSPGRVLWQSFDYPTNTLLPGMKLGMNLKTGQNWTLSSWLSGQVPSPGAFRLGVDPGGVNQLVVWRREEVYWTSGEWRNGSFQNAPDLTRRADLFEFSFVSNEEEKYFSYSVKSNSTHSRWELNAWGQILQFILATDGNSWENATIAGPCSLNVNYPEAVCIDQKPSKCRNSSEIFVPIRGFFRQTNSINPDYSANLSLGDCHAACWNNCSCVAYESVHNNGTGCLFLSKASDFVPNENFGYSYVLTSGTTRGK